VTLAGKVLVDRIDAELPEVQKQGQVVGFGVALTMGGRFHARAISELLDATTDADPAWRDHALGLIRLGAGPQAGRAPNRAGVSMPRVAEERVLEVTARLDGLVTVNMTI
jgi:hypothetical protein